MDGWQRALVLHARPYSETSLLLDFFNEYQRWVRVLAKGARSRRSALKEVLQSFYAITGTLERPQRSKNPAQRRACLARAAAQRSDAA